MRKEMALEYDAFIRSIKQNKDTPHSVLLGAGASISSGVISASDCIWEWKKDIYYSQNPNAIDYYKNIKIDSVRESIQNWIDQQGIYPELNSEGEYSYYAEKAYPIADDRRKYFQKIVADKVPSIGYRLLSLLCKQEIVKAVWTTNFDGLFVKAAFQENLTPIEITLDDADRIYRNQNSTEVLSVALHGDYKYSSLKNTSKELDSQDDVFSETLSRYHNDKNLIVIGYSGRDKSLMEALSQAFSQKGSGRLYWCGYGAEPGESVVELIETARKNNRQAFYVPTDGFDKTIIHLANACNEDDSVGRKRISELLAIHSTKKDYTTPFTVNKNRTDIYIKSNLHPISFPGEVYQFEVDFNNNRPWKLIEQLTMNSSICAVPFKGHVYALGFMSEISERFSHIMKGSIQRSPISVNDIRNNTAFNSLMLKVITAAFVEGKDLDSNGKGKIWNRKPIRINNNSGSSFSVHEALTLGFFFDEKKKYAFLSFKPSLFITGDEKQLKAVRIEENKRYFDKMHNNKYDAKLSEWNNLLFPDNKFKFEYPLNSGTAFNFSISKNTAFSEIMVLNPNYRSYLPQKYDNRFTQHEGIQLLEPQLEVLNKLTKNPSKDFHPMRALVSHRPWDTLLNGEIYSSNIDLAVVCQKKHSTRFFEFLSKLNQTHAAHHNYDYLIDYPGFNNVYKTPINIPYVDSEKWLDIDVDREIGTDIEKSIKLGQLIVDKIKYLNNKFERNVVCIFIPNEWSKYKKYETGAEKFDLHDFVKAAAATQGIATQFIEERTLSDSLLCQKLWWLSLSFYVKSMRTPWILSNVEKDTAFAGIGYSIQDSHNGAGSIVIGCSHIYNSLGQGLKYKLSKVDDFYLDKQKNPFLSYDDAYRFGVTILELFYSSMNDLPKRVVIHKRTPFQKQEIKGIVDSLSNTGIKNIDLVEINYESDARYFATRVYQGDLQIDSYPLSRGTCMLIDNNSALLWTHGIVPSVRDPKHRYYQGGNSIPKPLKITKHYGSTNVNQIATDILGLTKVNWNSFDLYTKLPATIESSNQIARIGKLLSRFEGQTYDYRYFI